MWGISHDEADEENAVRGFNRTNREYQVEVRDYMDYNAGVDQDASVVRFVVEAARERFRIFWTHT